jgi:pyruvate dehydrogenase E2 component (dihydrolipoamide acetyltransferase)
MARLAIRMPKMSMTMTEGEVSEWMVGVGAQVSEGDVVCEVMTDKVDMEVESTVSGTLVEIVVESGVAEVGAPIAWVEGEEGGGGFGDLIAGPADPAPATVNGVQPERPEHVPDDVPTEEVPASVLPAEPAPAEPAAEPADAAPTEATAEPIPERTPEPTPQPTPEPAAPPARSGPVSAVPRARGLAQQLGIDLATITGSGPDGLVLVADVEARSGQRTAPAAPATPPAAQPALAAAAAPAPTELPKPASKDRRTAIRKAVARAMIPTAAIPQFTVWREIRLDGADAVRGGLSWTTLLLRAYASALRAVPDLLTRWEDDGPVPAGPPAVALAVATDRGLLVPVFTEPDLDAAEDVDREIRQVIASARSGKLDTSYLGLANGSVSNLGGMGVDRFQALLTPPQASVLSLGSIRRRPVAVAGGVGTALTVEAGLTVDHRVADGAHAAELLDQFARRLGAQL